jgi:hypothetical protein
VTCLFWFESFTTLEQVLDNNSSQLPIQALVPDAIPKSNFRKWLTTILGVTQVSQNVILLALLFIYRLKQNNPTVKGKPGSEYRLLTVALMLSNKFLDDNTYSNKTWADVSGISVQEIHIMEIEFLSNIRYSLFASQNEWEGWKVVLGRFGTHYDRASRILVSDAITTTNVPLSSRSRFSNAPLLQPQTISTTMSPIGHLPRKSPIVRNRNASAEKSRT